MENRIANPSSFISKKVEWLTLADLAGNGQWRRHVYSSLSRGGEWGDSDLAVDK